MSILYGTLPENCVFSLACPPVDFRSLPAMSLRYVADRDEPLALWRVHLNVCCQIWTILTEQAQMLSVDLPSIYLPQDCEPFGKLSRFIDLQCRDVGVHDHLRKVLPGFSLSGVVDGDIRYRLLYSLNPIVGVIDGFRWCILGGNHTIYWPGLVVSCGTVGLFLVSGVWYFRRTERSFADVI